MKLRRTIKTQNPKKKKKERNNNNNNKEKRRGSWLEGMQQGSLSGQRICSKKNQHQGPMYVQMYAKIH